MAINVVNGSSCAQSSFREIPDDVVHVIFSKLNFPDLQRLVQVCSRFKLIAESEDHVKYLFEKVFSHRKPIANPAFSWKDQYRYAFEAESNLRAGKDRLTSPLRAHES